MTSEEINAAIERLRGMKTADRDFIVDVCRAFVGDCEVTGDELHYTLIELLEQADPNAHMELPRDADGVPIRVGDVMCDEDGKSFKVDEMLIDKTNDWGIFGGGYGEGFSEYDPATCHHYRKPTVEDLLHEMLEKAVGFSYAHTTVALNAISEYAAKLRELMADE